jgi:hypothetical protein
MLDARHSISYPYGTVCCTKGIATVGYIERSPHIQIYLVSS